MEKFSLENKGFSDICTFPMMTWLEIFYQGLCGMSSKEYWSSILPEGGRRAEVEYTPTWYSMPA